MKTRTNFDPPSDPYGDEVHCPTCDARMIQDSMGEWSCLEYHDDELVSQEYHKNKMYACPYCGSNNSEWICFDGETNGTTLVALQSCKCLACKAHWNEVFEWVRYEMIGTK